jgi:DNA-binding XRE family transcriptional regulator
LWITMSLYELFYHRRKSLSMTQDQVADTGLISRTAYKRIERGNGPNSPSLWVLESIARALGCRIELRLIDSESGEVLE